MLNPDIFAALDIFGGPKLLTGSLPSRHAKFLVSAVAGLTPVLKALMHLFSRGQGKTIGCYPTIPDTDHGQEYGTLVIPLWSSAPWWLLLI